MTDHISRHSLAAGKVMRMCCLLPFMTRLTPLLRKHALRRKLSNRKRKELSMPLIITGLKLCTGIKNKLHAPGNEVRYKYYRKTRKCSP